MSSLSFDGPLSAYLGWNALAFGLSFFLNSFIEWTVHRFVMHRPYWSFGYLHTTSHHAKFGADASYETQDETLKRHVLFTWKEYTLFPLLCLACYAPVEFLLGKPILLGILLSTLAGLQLFNSLHWRFHVPADTWFQRLSFFRYLKEHHRLHHGDMDRNFNVYFLPIADFCLGTLTRQK